MPDALRVVIAEDERAARERIRRVLDACLQEVHIAALCTTGEEAVAAIIEEQPDLVLLDVDMPGLDGFAVVERVGAAKMPFTIFVTAYDRFAVQAFEVNAVDYVLKPFTDERLIEAVARARLRIAERDLGSLHALLRYAAAGPALQDPTDAAADPVLLDKLMVRKGDRVLILPAERIDWIEAAGPYAELHCGTERHVVRLSMAHLEARLDGRRFVRIHRSTIVNLDRVAELQDHLRGEYFVILHDGTRLRLSRSRRVHFEQVMGQRL